MLSCDRELKADENWMSANASWVHDVRRGRRVWRTTGVQGFEGQGGKFKLYTAFSRKSVELFEKFI